MWATVERGQKGCVIVVAWDVDDLHRFWGVGSGEGEDKLGANNRS
jgi:hypothetical protein